MKKWMMPTVVTLSALSALCALCLGARASAPKAQPKWIGTWACAPMAEGKGRNKLPFEVLDSEGTIRDVVHVSAGGSVIRVRLSNEFGTLPLKVSGVHVAGSDGADATTVGTDHAVLFAGRPEVVLPVGAAMFSDPIVMNVAAESSLAISIFVPKQSGAVTLHEKALSTNYYAPGDQLAATRLTGPKHFNSWLLATGVDVQAGPESFTIVTIGDSITDGNASTLNANARWPDELGRRLQADPAHKNVGVVNVGISGNRVLQDGNGLSALHRFDHDVLGQSGVKYIVMLESTNDIGFAAHGRGGDIVTAAQVVEGMKQLVAKAHAKGIKMYGSTVLPIGGAQQGVPAGLKMRDEINRAILAGNVFDAVIDLSNAVADPADPVKLRADYDSGLHVHPSDAGYKAMGEAFDLKLFH